MHKLHIFLSIPILVSFLTGCVGNVVAQVNESTPTAVAEKVESTTTTEVVSKGPPASCPITSAPDVPFVPPDPYPSEPPARYVDQFWYGSPQLWTMLGSDATWINLPQDRDGFTQKIFWWSQDFDVNTEPYPAFTVTGEQLDVPASSLVFSEEATNASADFGTAMLTGVSIPTPGCWKIMGKYKDAELSFVVWVAP